MTQEHLRTLGEPVETRNERDQYTYIYRRDLGRIELAHEVVRSWDEALVWSPRAYPNDTEASHWLPTDILGNVDEGKTASVTFFNSEGTPAVDFLIKDRKLKYILWINEGDCLEYSPGTEPDPSNDD